MKNKNETIFYKTVRGRNIFFFYLDIIFFDNLFLFEIVRVNIMPKIPYGKKKQLIKQSIICIKFDKTGSIQLVLFLINMANSLKRNGL